MSSIYQYSSYKSLLMALIAKRPNAGRGVRTELAKFLRCQSPFITQVLSGPLHFSEEQAEACGRYFGLSLDEVEYFLTLVSYEKAGTKELRELKKSALEKMRDKSADVSDRLEIKSQLNSDVQARYYSSWHYAAVHMALTVPSLRTAEALVHKLGLSKTKVMEVLKFLLEQGLIAKHLHQYESKNQWLHLTKDSPMLSKHHANLRLKVMHHLDEPAKTDVHYSAFFSCSKKDLGQLQELLLKTLEGFQKTVKTSPEEELAGIALDLFKI